MQTNSSEMEKFENAMKRILRADPKAVKVAMEAEKQKREEQRKAKRASADHASTEKD